MDFSVQFWPEVDCHGSESSSVGAPEGLCARAPERSGTGALECLIAECSSAGALERSRAGALERSSARVLERWTAGALSLSV